MRNSTKLVVHVLAVAFMAFLSTAAMAVGGGIPEPGLTMYGAVKNDIGGCMSG